MISMSTMLGIVFTLIVCFILPIGSLIVLGVRNRNQGIISAWLLGAAGFFVMQIVIRIPILNHLSTNTIFTDFATKNYVLYCLILAFTAALSELIGRVVVAKIISKNMTVSRAMAAGFGHGGIEAIVVIGVMYINNIVYAAMINAGTFDQVVEQTAALGVDTSSLVAVKDALINTSSISFWLAGYERIVTVFLHVGLTMLVCYFMKKNKLVIGCIICLVVHTVVDFMGPLINIITTQYLENVFSQTASYIVMHTVITVLTVGTLIYVKKLIKDWE